MTVIKRLANSYRRRRFACLFISLFVTLVASPVFAALGFSARFMELLVVLNLLAAVLVTQFKFEGYVGASLLVLVLAVRGGYALMGYKPLLMTSHFFGVAICLISAIIMLRYILSEGSVDSECIFSALSLYLLIGLIYGLLFFIFEEGFPGSLSFQGASLDGSTRIQMANTMYFSFVTLGTLGYGDIIPIGGPARALAVTEAIGGQIYLVVVVARLVSLYRGGTDRTDHS
jgi:Ion channel